MAARILIEASDVWGYFINHKKELYDEMKMIADNHEYGIEVYLTISNDLPLIIVTADDEEVYGEPAATYYDCKAVVSDIYNNYLSNEVLNILANEEEGIDADEELETEEELIDKRKMELIDVAYIFLETAVPDICDVADDVDTLCENVVDHICEYLYKKYGISIYRPMYLEDEDGSDYFTKYPYPEMEMED